MKISVMAIVEKKIEVNDKFAVLGVAHPNHLPYPDNISLFEELEQECKEKTGWSFVHNKLSDTVPQITDIVGEEGVKEIMLW